MQLVPKHELENKIKHLRVNSATLASNSVAAAGTGFVFVPVYAWAVGSAAATLTCFNGTGGSNLFEWKLVPGTYAEMYFWEEPSVMSTNKCLVIESNTGIGVHDFHVWYVKVRGGAGANSGAGNETALTGL